MNAPLLPQPSLFGGGEPSIDPARLSGMQRIALDETAWIERLPGWVNGHEPLLAILFRATTWQKQRRRMYDRSVDVPRLVARIPEDSPGHPLLTRIRDVVAAHYATAFPHVSLAYYRDGSDSVAWHGDTTARDLPEALVVTVSLGEPRRFLLRPKAGGRSLALSLGWGDLLVMGGSCQRTWQHSIPKVAQALPRMSVMFRPSWYKP